MSMSSSSQPLHEHRGPTLFRMFIVTMALLFFITGAAIWIAGGLGVIPELRSSVLSLIVVVGGAVFALFLLIFQWVSFVPPMREEDAGVPSPRHTVQPQSRPVNGALVQPTKTVEHHSLGLPPPTNPKTVQQREKVVKEVYAQLVSPDITAIVLTGIAGVGKSTLAALIYRYAEEQRGTSRGRFSAQAIWIKVEAAAVAMTDLATKLFEALGKSAPDFGGLSPQEQASALFNAMNSPGKARLIILDQFESVLDWQTGQVLAEHDGVAEWLDALNSQGCNCRVLLTSRPWPKAAREYPRTHMQEYVVRGLEIDEGIELLRKQGIDATVEEMSTAVKRCTGHAFALVLLASIVLHNPSLSLTDLFNSPTYMQLWRGDIAQKLLDHIYMKQLKEVQRDLLLAFSVFREAVSLEAAVSLMKFGATLPKQDILSALHALLAQHLLEATGKGRYQLHAIVVEYAQGHFDERDEHANQQALEAAHAQAAQYYMLEALQNYRPHGYRKSIDDVHPLVEAIWQTCLARQWSDAYDLMDKEKLFNDLKRLGGNAILLELYRQLLPLEKWSADSAQAMRIYINLGRVCRTLGQKDEAREYLELALPLCEQEGDARQKGVVLSYLGRVYADMGQKDQALTYFEEALQLRKEIEDREGEGVTLDNLGRVYEELGQYEHARTYCLQALEILREIGNRRAEGRTLSTLGRVLNKLGQQKEAQEYLEQSLEILRGVGDRGGEGRTLHNLGLLYADLGDRERARDLYEQALSIRKEISYRRGVGNTLQNLGQVYGDLGQKDRALQYFNQALSVLREVGDQRGEGSTLYNAGMLYYKRRRYDVALAYFLFASSVLRDIQSPVKEENQKSIEALRGVIGEQQYALLLEKVGSQPSQYVEWALQEALR